MNSVYKWNKVQELSKNGRNHYIQLCSHFLIKICLDKCNLYKPDIHCKNNNLPIGKCRCNKKKTLKISRFILLGGQVSDTEGLFSTLCSGSTTGE